MSLTRHFDDGGTLVYDEAGRIFNHSSVKTLIISGLFWGPPGYTVIEIFLKVIHFK